MKKKNLQKNIIFFKIFLTDHISMKFEKSICWYCDFDLSWEFDLGIKNDKYSKSKSKSNSNSV